MISITWLIFLPLFFLSDLTHSARILFLYPIASKSETHIFLPIVKALASAHKNHSIVIVSPVQSENLDPRIVKQIIPTSPLREKDFFPNVQTARELFKNKLTVMYHVNKTVLVEKCHSVYQNQQIQNLIASQYFDLVILSGLANFCLEGIIHKVGSPPFIVLTALQTPSPIISWTGWHLPTSTVPATGLFTDQMSFSDRLTNTVVLWMYSFLYQWHYGPTSAQIYQHYLGMDVPSHGEIERNVSLIFSNSHPAISFPSPLPPEVIEIGGIHCRGPEPLPQDIQDFIDGAEHGIIYFSLGTMVEYKDLPKNADEIFLNVFSRLKQKIIWQRDENGMSLAPKSKFLFQKWLPQQDILGHSNTKLFISHGGLLGIIEAAYHETPLLGIPLFLDHDQNVDMVENKRFGIKLELLDLTEEIFEDAIHTLLNDTSYMSKVKEISKILKDQQNTPLDTAVYWTEFVLRHKGAHHLRSPARHLNFFQYHSVDVIFAIGFGFAVFVLFLYLFLKNIYNSTIRLVFTSEKLKEKIIAKML